MKLFKSSICIFLVVALSSCVSYRTVLGPYDESISGKLKKGDIVKLTLVNRTEIRKTKVMEVWPDSVMLDASPRAIQLSDVATMRKSEPDPVATAMLVLLPVGLLIFIATQPVVVPTPFKI